MLKVSRNRSRRATPTDATIREKPHPGSVRAPIPGGDVPRTL
jgi:hypothetical protein